MEPHLRLRRFHIERGSKPGLLDQKTRAKSTELLAHRLWLGKNLSYREANRKSQKDVSLSKNDHQSTTFRSQTKAIRNSYLVFGLSVGLLVPLLLSC